ncbi:MAG: MetQ/NlpA family ABC transporter substrate-binding protein [Synergistaceae bacterium]|jgi:D-methionine transport system substrate-binding protein|nr:MetQ/NlpA family ABC transporter substrate-binding protein [Synergistaceae bacterium]
MRKFIAVKFFVVFSVLVLSGALAGGAEAAFKLGATSGPQAEVAEAAKKAAAARGLEIEIVEFSDYVQPNAALADGELDANAYQHLPYLRNTIKNTGYKLVPIGNTVLLPMAGYSKRVKSLGELRNGATVTIPNDPSNGGRALLLLAAQGLIELDPAAGILPSVTDVTKNERALKFVELDAAQLPRALDDADIAVINTNYAIEAGLVPTRDALFIESKDSPYVCVIAVREGEKDRPEFKILVESYQNDEVKKFVEERFKGSLVAGW